MFASVSQNSRAFEAQDCVRTRLNCVTCRAFAVYRLPRVCSVVSRGGAWRSSTLAYPGYKHRTKTRIKYSQNQEGSTQNVPVKEVEVDHQPVEHNSVPREGLSPGTGQAQQANDGATSTWADSTTEDWGQDRDKKPRKKEYGLVVLLGVILALSFGAFQLLRSIQGTRLSPTNQDTPAVVVDPVISKKKSRKPVDQAVAESAEKAGAEVVLSGGTEVAEVTGAAPEEAPASSSGNAVSPAKWEPPSLDSPLLPPPPPPPVPRDEVGTSGVSEGLEHGAAFAPAAPEVPSRVVKAEEVEALDREATLANLKHRAQLSMRAALSALESAQRASAYSAAASSAASRAADAADKALSAADQAHAALQELSEVALATAEARLARAVEMANRAEAEAAGAAATASGQHDIAEKQAHLAEKAATLPRAKPTPVPTVTDMVGEALSPALNYSKEWVLSVLHFIQQLYQSLIVGVAGMWLKLVSAVKGTF